jgi:hypothetical protein
MTLKPGNIQFHQWCKPPLAAGDYSLDVTQTVDQLGETAASLAFSVAGPRFSLNPSDIYSVYPPKGESGAFANSLPHVVFTRRTLPWERHVTPGHQPAADRPWMALLLFTSDDEGGVPEIKQRPVSELVNPSAADAAVGPAIARLDAGESWQEPCNVIDVRAGTFQAIAPRLVDLPFLAHVREVETDHKETMSLLADGWFSIVVGNRFPKPQQKDGGEAIENTVFLVSLEGLGDYLPGGRTPLPAPNVRLAVLASWSFRCYAAFDFKSLMGSLEVGTLNLPPPNGSAADANEPLAAAYVAGAFTRGYVALNHRTRQGEPTVSWCRGPLTPAKVEAEARYPFHAAPDGLLRYDFNTGVMDVTYAAASQLGRLLALQDRSFARALDAWRTSIQQKIRASADEQTPVRALQSVATTTGIDAALATAIGAPRVSAATDPGTLFQAANMDSIVPQTNRIPPSAVRQWLARLILLYRVPFINLVPHEGLLPPSSMRFFRIDPRWIKCLLEGACSVGRNSTEQQAVDEFLGNRFLDFLGDAVAGVRRRRASEDEASQASAPRKVNWPLEGFLLRSTLVEGWQGLEMRAWQTWDAGTSTGVPVDPLRIDRLAPDVMIGIFDGPVVRIEVKQPPEGMHFGASTRDAAYFKGNLRRVSPEDAAGDQLAPRQEVAIPIRTGTARVVDTALLANQFEKVLKSDSVTGMDATSTFTSAEFGLQMTESPGRVAIFATSSTKPS